MSAQPALHPTDQTLQSYGLGKLDDASAESVHQHLEDCPDCRRRAGEISPDSFLGRLRDAQAPPDSFHPAVSSTDGLSMLDGAAVAPAPPPASTLPPGLADHPDYEILRELGRGGMGVVYLAQNTLMGRMEVLKVVGGHLVNRKGVLDRFSGEIRNAARLHHPNIVAAYSAIRLGESLVLAMEYVEGLDLSRLVKAKGPLPVANACNYIHQAALGLQHAHEHGMVHRDIKPGNLMLSRQGNRPVVKVLDFGLAKVQSEGAVDGGLTLEGQMLGTPDYIAPEQTIDARKADIRADIYSLGCTLYYLLTGAPPFQGTSLYDILQAHHSRDAMPLNLARPEVPVEVAALVAKMMAKEPERRFQEPKDVTQALKPFSTSGNAAAGSRPEVSQADPAAGRAVRGTTSTPARPSTNAGGPSIREKKTAEPAVAGARWVSPIDFKEDDPEVRPDKPTPAKKTGRRPPWKSMPLVAAASIFGLAMLGVIIIIILKNGRATIDADKGKATITFEPPTEPRNSAPADKPPGARDGRDANPSELAEATILRGEWTIDGDELVQSEEHGDATLAFGDGDWSDYDLTLEAKKVGGRGNGLRVIFHRMGSESYCYYSLGDCDNVGATLTFVHQGQGSRKGDANKDNWAWEGINLGQWYPIKIKIRKNHFECYLKNNLMFDESHSSFSHGRIALCTSGTRARFRHIKVTDPRGKLLFEGPPGGVPTEVRARNDVIKPSTRAVPKIGTIALFNGKDRNGWSDVNRNGSKWEVSNGVLVGRGGGAGKPAVLVSRRQDLTDFRLRAEVRFPAGGWGWIELRRPDASDRCSGYVVVDGLWPPWARAESVGSVTKAAGHEYGKALGWDYRADPIPLVANSWNLIEVTLIENRIVTAINGRKVSEYTDVRGSYDSGGIALVCQDNSEIHYRSITVEDPPPVVGAGGLPDKPAPGSSSITNTIGMKLTLIPAGEFLMGSPDADRDAERDEKPAHLVRITRSFYLGTYEVTRRQFRRFVDEDSYRTEAERDGKGGWGWNEDAKKHEPNAKWTWRNLGFDQDDEHPVVNVSWNDAVAFAAWMSRKEGKRYRLPTEAEWEYACRAKTTTKYYSGDDPESLAAVGNIADGTAREKYPSLQTIKARDGYAFTAPVGRFRPNGFGLYDMHGNVWEWCWDRAADDYYKRSPVDDPPGPSEAAGGWMARVAHGSGWWEVPHHSRSAFRGKAPPDYRRADVGFRLALIPSDR